VALLSFAPLFFAQPAHANCVSSYESQVIAATELDINSTEAVVRTIETCGGDDISYQIPLTTTVMFDGIEYSNIYATTNSVITFGRPDGTYWTYPGTPSISLYSFDWVVYPQWRADEHLIIRSSDGGFQVDISARPIWLQNTTEPTHIVITAAILSDGTVAMAYTLSGPEYPQYNPRTGVRLNNGEIVDFEIYGIQQTEEAPELAAEPTEEAPFNPPASETSTRTEDVTRTKDVARTEEVVREPEPVQPAPQPVQPEPEPIVTPEPEPEVEPIPESLVEPVEPTEPEVEESPQPEPVEPPTELVEPEISPEVPVEPENEPIENFEDAVEAIQEAVGEAVEAVQEAIIETFESAVEAVTEVVEAFQTAGLDMTEEERKTAQSVVVPSVIVAQIATLTFRK